MYFASLAENNDNDVEYETDGNTVNSDQKPPPILIPYVDDIRSMVNKFSEIIKDDELAYTSLSDGNVRVITILQVFSLIPR